MIREKERIPYAIWLALAILVVLLAVMLLADTVTRHDPTEMDLAHKLEGHSAEFLLGTDEYGRCIFCRCVYAMRNSVGIAFSVELISVFLGMVLGMLAAWFGGVFDQLFNLVSNALMSFPNVILIMLIVAFLGASTQNIILAMLLVDWIWYARISRSLTLSVKERKYVQAAKLSGAGTITILRRHICPSILSQMAVQFTLSLGNVILSLAGFSFLGIGIQRPTPELGIMISDGCGLIRTNFMVLLWPGLLLFLLVLDFNVIGEWLSARLRKKA